MWRVSIQIQLAWASDRTGIPVPPGTSRQIYLSSGTYLPCEIERGLLGGSTRAKPFQFAKHNHILKFRNSAGGSQQDQTKMALPRSLLQYICSLVLLVGVSQALKFELQGMLAHYDNKMRCIRNFVAKDTLVVVTSIVSGSKGDGMVVNLNVGFGSCLGFWLCCSSKLTNCLSPHADQGCRWQRIRKGKGRRWRAEDSLYITRRRGIRRVLREHTGRKCVNNLNPPFAPITTTRSTPLRC